MPPGDSSAPEKAICLPTAFLDVKDWLLPLVDGVPRPPGVLGSPPLPTALFGLAAAVSSVALVFRVDLDSALSSDEDFSLFPAPRAAAAPFFADLPFVVFRSYAMSDLMFIVFAQKRFSVASIRKVQFLVGSFKCLIYQRNVSTSSVSTSVGEAGGAACVESPAVENESGTP